MQTIVPYSFSSTSIEEIFIPSSVIKICEGAFSYCEYLTKVEIQLNSNLQTNGKHAFYNTEIEELYFPPSLKELKEGWCTGANKLTKIIISPIQGQFTFKEDKYLLGKSEISKEEFDNLLFVRRDIK